MMRKEYQLTEEQYRRLIEASKPIPYMVFGGMEPRSPQENANAAWAVLGNELGFDWTTVERSSKGKMFFTAADK